MSWNHRVMRSTDPEGERFFEIHEVYYTDSGEVRNWTARSLGACGDTVEGVRWSLERMMEALDKPVLDFETGKEVES